MSAFLNRFLRKPKPDEPKKCDEGKGMKNKGTEKLEVKVNISSSTLVFGSEQIQLKGSYHTYSAITSRAPWPALGIKGDAPDEKVVQRDIEKLRRVGDQYGIFSAEISNYGRTIDCILTFPVGTRITVYLDIQTP
jgi:hypothetical protein